jgi:hypothetical protein
LIAEEGKKRDRYSLIIYKDQFYLTKEREGKKDKEEHRDISS